MNHKPMTLSLSLRRIAKAHKIRRGQAITDSVFEARDKVDAEIRAIRRLARVKGKALQEENARLRKALETIRDGAMSYSGYWSHTQARAALNGKVSAK